MHADAKTGATSALIIGASFRHGCDLSPPQE
jgi:hypothetical protein